MEKHIAHSILFNIYIKYISSVHCTIYRIIAAVKLHNCNPFHVAFQFCVYIIVTGVAAAAAAIFPLVVVTHPNVYWKRMRHRHRAEI